MESKDYLSVSESPRVQPVWQVERLLLKSPAGDVLQMVHGCQIPQTQV